MYMLVSHRDMISVFDMSQGANEKSEWIDTIQFKTGHIRQMFIKKISKERRQFALLENLRRTGLGADAEGDKHLSVFKKYEIVILNGLTDIVSCGLLTTGKID